MGGKLLWSVIVLFLLRVTGPFVKTFGSPIFQAVSCGETRSFVHHRTGPISFCFYLSATNSVLFPRSFQSLLF